MGLSQEIVGCSLQVRKETLLLVEEFKYLGILFMSDGKREGEMEIVTGSSVIVHGPIYRGEAGAQYLNEAPWLPHLMVKSCR